MSAFLVEDTTINRIVSWLAIEITRSHWLRGKLTAYCTEHGLPSPLPASDAWEKVLAQRMFQLNIAGVEARYGKGEAADFRELNFRYQPVLPPADIQALKSMNCWLYQCMEGTVPEQPLYRFFDEVVVRYVLGKIVYTLPEYDQAEWG